jgi:hypothetical protein
MALEIKMLILQVLRCFTGLAHGPPNAPLKSEGRNASVPQPFGACPRSFLRFF